MGTKNAKLPLAYSSHRQIVDADGNLVIEVFSGGSGIEAADELQSLVVTACNAHNQLVEALENILSMSKTASGGVRMSHVQIFHLARNALAAAGAA